ncbi:hypothetical protein WS61_03330 [Burkholderia sp. ABCPW 11]|nr:hypothetical protein WS61_03330 [Burkholderia sp. ABCPW 11]
MDVECLRDLDRGCGFQQPERLYLLLRRQRVSASKHCSSLFGRGQAGLRSLADQRALELGERRHQMKDERATCGFGGDGFRHGFETHAALLERYHEFHELGQRATQTIQPPYDQGVAGFQAAQCFSESGTLEVGAGDPFVPIDRRAACARECVFLKTETLFIG